MDCVTGTYLGTYGRDAEGYDRMMMRMDKILVSVTITCGCGLRVDRKGSKRETHSGRNQSRYHIQRKFQLTKSE